MEVTMAVTNAWHNTATLVLYLISFLFVFFSHSSSSSSPFFDIGRYPVQTSTTREEVAGAAGAVEEEEDITTAAVDSTWTTECQCLARGSTASARLLRARHIVVPLLHRFPSPPYPLPSLELLALPLSPFSPSSPNDHPRQQPTRYPRRAS